MLFFCLRLSFVFLEVGCCSQLSASDSRSLAVRLRAFADDSTTDEGGDGEDSMKTSSVLATEAGARSSTPADDEVEVRV